LDELNLENKLKIVARSDARVIQEIDEYFERIRHNEKKVYLLHPMNQTKML